jgi:phosphoribosyl-AMP cyclohydrolase / phosphoribosyl-ATP pyrophosphohydrolase
MSLKLNFNKNADELIPAVVQDYKTKRVLMLGFMNREAHERTVSSGKVTFFSRTKQRLWTKGESSGNFMEVVRIIEDCDHDTVLIYAKPVGPVCHKGTDTCFGEVNVSDDYLLHLQETIKKRKLQPKDGSYTSSLFAKGINKVAQKVGEEAVELVIEAKDNNDELFLNEAADLLYHYMILLSAKNYSLEDVVNVLKSRAR